MLKFVKGLITEKSKNQITLFSNNIGFEINILNRDNFEISKEYKVFIHDYLSSDNEFLLYGFLDENDYKVFKKLIKIQGIGCKSAINILNLIKANDLIFYVKNENFKVLQEMIGSKANTIILNLKKNLYTTLEDNKYESVYLALKNLGYKKEQIIKSLDKINQNLSQEEALKQALKIINYE